MVQALHRGCRGAETGNYQFLIALELSAVPDADKLRQCLLRALELFPPLRGGLKRHLLNLAPYWKPVRSAATALAPEFTCTRADTPEAVQAQLEKLLNTETAAREPLLSALLLECPGGTSVFACKFDHRIFDAGGGERFMTVLQKCWNLEHIEPDALMPSVGPWLNEWKHQFECGRTVNRVMRSLYAQGVPAVLYSGQAASGVNRYRLVHISGDDFVRLNADSERIAGTMMLMPYIQTLIQRCLRRILKERGVENAFCLCPLSVDLRKSGDAGLFFNHWSLMPMYSHESATADFAQEVEAQKELFYEYMKNRFPYCLTKANLLTRIVPLPLFAWFSRAPFRGTAGTAMTALLNREEFKSAELFGCRVDNLYHIPGIPARPGVGVFINRRGNTLNLCLSWLDGALSEREAELLSECLSHKAL